MLIDLQVLKDYLLIIATLVGIIKSIFELCKMVGEVHFKKITNSSMAHHRWESL